MIKKKLHTDSKIRGKSSKNIANIILLKDDIGEKDVNRVSIKAIVIIENNMKEVKIE
jgi:hypothetical protein